MSKSISKILLKESIKDLESDVEFYSSMFKKEQIKLVKVEQQLKEITAIATEYAEHMYFHGGDPIYSSKLHKKIDNILEAL